MRSVASIYDENAEGEWRRLAKSPYQSLEFSVTMDRLAEHLPGEGRVLDVGGGPGRYSIELCRRGYQVVLLELLCQGEFQTCSVCTRLSAPPPFALPALPSRTVSDNTPKRCAIVQTEKSS